MSWIFDSEELASWWFYNVDCSLYFPYICVFMWTIGMLGNLASLIVFNSKQSFINSLFCWLAICDFLELVLFGILVFNDGFKLVRVAGEFVFLQKSNRKYFDIIAQRPIFLVTILLIFFHNISILFNITLAFSQYLMVVYPLKYRQLFSGRQSSKRKVIGSIFIINFVFSTLMFLYPFFGKEKHMMMEMKYNESGDMYLYSRLGKISDYNEIINDVKDQGPFYWDIINNFPEIYPYPPDRSAMVFHSKSAIYSVLYEDPGDEFKENFTEEYIERRYQKLFSFNETIYPIIDGRFKLHKRISLIYLFSETIFGSWIDVLNCLIIRLGLLIALMVACIGLIFGILKVRRERHNLVDSVQTPNQQSSMDSATNQMINMTLVIVFIFTIVEIPILIIFNSSLVPLKQSLIFFDYRNRIGFIVYTNVFSLNEMNTKLFICNILLSISLFISSSYTIFCYLIMNAQYRKILKHILYNGYKSLKKFFWLPYSVQWGYRATYQQTPQIFELI